MIEINKPELLALIREMIAGKFKVFAERVKDGRIETYLDYLKPADVTPERILFFAVSRGFVRGMRTVPNVREATAEMLQLLEEVKHT